MIRSAGILCKPIRTTVATVVPPLIEWLRARGISAFVDPETLACMGGSQPVRDRDALTEQSDLLIVLGGDGTLLAAARALRGRPVPILAVNLGGLGFLTSVTLDELYPMLEQVLAGQHRTIERMMLEAQILRDGKTAERQSALNDAVMNKAALARMLDFDVYVDKDHVGRYRADGLIVATPTGSTAYSLAAGGPVVHPDLDALVITPICPHMLTNRPLVVPDTACVEIDFSEAEEPVYLTLDGQVGLQLRLNDRVAITKSASRVRFVRPAQKTYFEVLRSKLRWGER
ncbi:MAG TPA: NAD(+)/NADH kinase [Candidatus Acidoferrales bacterium]|nr:NAD(+)/NADH kinase [Candidatus Acidoferrales bacterium]